MNKIYYIGALIMAILMFFAPEKDMVYLLINWSALMVCAEVNGLRPKV